MAVNTETREQALTRLLVISRDNGTVNRLISTLRQEGLAVRPAVAADLKQLTKLLNQDQWDVLVLYGDTGVTPDALLARLHKHEQDIPVILVDTAAPGRDNKDALELFRLGVRDLVPPGESSRLVVSIAREAQQYSLKKQLRHQEIRQRELEKRHEQLLQDSPVAICYLRDGIHLYCNQSYADIFGYPDIATISTTPFLNLIAAKARAEVKAVMARAEESPQSGTVQVQRHDGSETELTLSLSPVEFQGRTCLQMTVQQPGGNAEYSAEVARISGMDLLTRLDNRGRFLDKVEDAIRTAVQRGGFSSLILIEVDDFDDVRTAIGKSSSNIVLNDIALFLRDTIEQPFAAGRLDDHVFGLIIYNGDPDVALGICSSIREKVNNRISSAMLSSLELSCSVGMTLINGHALNAAEVVERARVNMEQKPGQDEQGTVFRIGDSLEHDAGDMLAYLNEALENQRFKPAFQPIVGISGNNQRFYEVLIRMLDKDDNEILPGAFLPLANLNGMGVQIDRMVVGMALASLHSSEAVQRLTVNITSNTLMSQTFLPWLSEQLQATRIQADRLAIDISEIDIHSSLQDALEFCKGLEVLGVKLTLSHFGCALEPFSILDQLKPELVTLDETVVRDLVYSSHQKANVQSMVQALHDRGLQVVTPQVENMAVLPILWEIGIDYVQGYCVQAPSNEMNFEFVQDEEITLTAPSQ